MPGILLSWCPGQGDVPSDDPCKPCKPPDKAGCLVPYFANITGEIICYWVNAADGKTGGPVGCGYRDTNLRTGVVTTYYPYGCPFPPTEPTLYAGETLITSTTLSWATVDYFGNIVKGSQGQIDFPPVYYTAGSSDPVANAAGVSQSLDQVMATLNAAACQA